MEHPGSSASSFQREPRTILTSSEYTQPNTVLATAHHSTTRTTPTKSIPKVSTTSKVQAITRSSRIGVRLQNRSGAKVFVTDVTQGSLSDLAGVKVGQQLVRVNLGDRVLNLESSNFVFNDNFNYASLLELLRTCRPVELVFSKPRDQLFEEALCLGDVDMIKKLAFHGIPDHLRSDVWCVLLGYFGEKSKWTNVQSQHSILYQQYKTEFLMKTEGGRRPERLEGQGWWERADEPKSSNLSLCTKDTPQVSRKNEPATADVPGATKLEWAVALDDPLSAAVEDNVEVEESGDRELREEIWKDAQRTHPGLHFFTERCCEALERILFIYAKLNPGIRYVQGMNEILAPIVFTICGSGELNEQHETDAFFCFCNLMGEIRDMYIKELDDDQESNGIKGRLASLTEILKEHDNVLLARMEELQLHPHYFALRWITTLLAREFELPETVRLWDTLFADPERFRFLLYVCCTMLINQREFILRNDFATCMKLLQRYPITEITVLLAQSRALAESETKPSSQLSSLQTKLKSVGSLSQWIKNSMSNTSKQKP